MINLKSSSEERKCMRHSSLHPVITGDPFEAYQKKKTKKKGHFGTK